MTFDLNVFVSGGCAGTAVDVTLFPLDTIKTRMQSKQGFKAAGGFNGVYAGLGPVALGSAPGAAVFFFSYESFKSLCEPRAGERYLPLVHMSAACVGEVTSCAIRVPIEVIKQRAQTNSAMSSVSILRNVMAQDGFRGLYRGYMATVQREIPFSVLQYPLWEGMKRTWANYQGSALSGWQSALCGALAGAFSAAVTTPLDVAKTRIMLAPKGSVEAKGHMPTVVRLVYREAGLAGIFAGVIPRVCWIGIGGFVYFGVYDSLRNFFHQRDT
ncbi:mitochondrial S-adenosylmethionine carrier protein-like [Sycon ciliatum]|uniref:mitochondrial S-adenosylmethionine carrier protein-like n=1 Tax=Sycon ciliatum TaxID=27933 RepID=UPI0031F6EC7A